MRVSYPYSELLPGCDALAATMGYASGEAPEPVTELIREVSAELVQFGEAKAEYIIFDSVRCDRVRKTVRGGRKPGQFAIAGDDMKFFWADARIKGEQVILKSGKVKKPVAARYAWADNPAGANLYNREGLPAAPFRTDGRQ